MKNQNYHEKIWKEVKPFIESIETAMDLLKLRATDNEKEYFRLINTERQFIRGIILAESENYVSEKKPTKEGFVIDLYAVEYCYVKMFKKHFKENNSKEKKFWLKEAHEWAFVGMHPEINDKAKKSYKKGMLECMKQLSLLAQDKSLDFNAPVVRMFKSFFKGIFN